MQPRYIGPFVLLGTAALLALLLGFYIFYDVPRTILAGEHTPPPRCGSDLVHTSDEEEQQLSLEDLYLRVREREIMNYVEVATSAIEQIVRTAPDRESVQSSVRSFVEQFHFGSAKDRYDGYLFIWDMQSEVAVAHAAMPSLVGRQAAGDERETIKALIARARECPNSGGFFEYTWERPSTRGREGKLAYVSEMREQGWLVGTGLYLRELENPRLRFRNALHVTQVASAFASLMGAIVLIWFLISRRTIRRHQAAVSDAAQQLYGDLTAHLLTANVLFQRVLNGVRPRLPDGPGDMVDRVRRTCVDDLEKGIEALRQASFDLLDASRPLALLAETKPLEATLASALAVFRERTGVPSTLRTKGHAHTASPAVYYALYRTAQHALRVFERTRSGGELSVALECSPRWITLTIHRIGERNKIVTSTANASEQDLETILERLKEFSATKEAEFSEQRAYISVRVPVLGWRFTGARSFITRPLANF